MVGAIFMEIMESSRNERIEVGGGSTPATHNGTAQGEKIHMALGAERT